MKSIQTIPEFRKSLAATLAFLIEWDELGWQHQSADPEWLVDEARRTALRLHLPRIAAACVANRSAIKAAEIVATALAELDESPDGPLTVKQAAERLGISTKTVYQLCNDGKLRHKRIGRTIKIEAADLAELDSPAGRRCSIRELEKCFA
jgi:excisionase family DNA binding protein